MRLIRIINLFCIPLFVCAFLFLLFVNNLKRSTGKLVFENETVHFGEIPLWQNEPITKLIKCRNVGRKKLVIQRVNSNCGCYSVTQYPRQLAPGEIGTFVITADPPNAKPEASVHVVTDSPQQSDVYFSVLATIKPYAEFLPAVCDFGEIHTNTVHEKPIQLHINGPFKKESVQLAPINDGVVSGSLEQGNASDFELKIQLGPIDSQGFFSTVFTCILPGDRTITLPVIAQVVGRVKVSPEMLVYGQGTKTEPPILDVTLQSEMPFKILKVDAPKFLGVKIGDSSGTHQTTVIAKVQLYPDEVQDNLREEIQVFTNVEREPIRIPVYAAINR